MAQYLECLGTQRDLFDASPQKTGFEVQCKTSKTIFTAGPFSRVWLRSAQADILASCHDGSRAAPRIGGSSSGSDEFVTTLSLRHHYFKLLLMLAFYSQHTKTNLRRALRNKGAAHETYYQNHTVCFSCGRIGRGGSSRTASRDEGRRREHLRPRCSVRLPHRSH